MRSTLSALFATLAILSASRLPAASPPAPPRPPAARGVAVTWLGQACFQLVPTAGPRIVIDPYGPIVGPYPWPNPTADVVLVTHEHPDHNAVDRVRGNPVVVREGVGMRRARGLAVLGTAAFHDDQGGRQFGPDTLYTFTLDGIRFCHLGDLGQRDLTPGQIHLLGRIDVLFIPVGGHFTIDGKAADRIIAQIHPRIVVPMHYKTQFTDPKLPLVGVEGFLAGKQNVRRLSGNSAAFSPRGLPKSTTIIVLAPPRS